MITGKIKQLIQSHLDSVPEGQIPLICIIGPTAVGKTALSIGLAKAFDGEIISADSRQVYKGMDVGTDKITEEEMDGVPHHMIDIVEPDEDFTVYDFKTRADKIIPEIHERGHVPFIVGGTMLYTDAVVGGFDFDHTEPDEELRRELQRFLDEKGKAALHKKLQELNPKAAQKIHLNNTHYVMRAIEKASEKNDLVDQGQRLKSQDANTSNVAKDTSCLRALCPYYVLKIGLIRPRQELYDRINKRVEQQLEDGKLESEAKYFINKYGQKERSITGLGYRQFIPYFNGEIKADGTKYSLEDVLKQLQQETRNFAKRQLSWWRKDEDVKWFNISDAPDSEIEMDLA